MSKGQVGVCPLQDLVSKRNNMKELFDLNDLDSWYLEKKLYKNKTQVNPKTYALYFCEPCKHVWEISCTGTIIRYKHLPTYGLKRIACPYCKNGHNKTYKEKNND